MSVTGERDDLGGGPQKVGVAVADLFTGMYASVGILAALRHAEKTGEGQYTGCSRVFKRFLQSVLIKCSQMFRFVSQRKNAFLKMRQKTGKNRPLQMLDAQHLILLHNSRVRKMHGC